MDRGQPLAAAQQQDRIEALRLGFLLRVPEQTRQIVERISTALPFDLALHVQIDERLTLDLLDLLHHRRRQRPQASAGADEHRLRHGERERQVEHEARAFAFDRLNFDAATERCDLRAHDVHADAATGDLRDFRRR